ncbi:MAG TPA: T9SS type A sorting domain-containing protein [Saprospiraceae bacterium]|jgi:hypothetical protein|nr:T9SS type A sorting domain-containing protein [Saprospiraceae bacterium]HMT71623.1 T9SS type A sorting domain-containing protein [Saprospiraceae bacterium]
MKIFKNSILFFFIFYPSILILYGQCANVELFSQDDINNFIKNYGKCKSINNLRIIGNNDNFQFDSLYNLEKIEGLFELQASKVKNLNGLHNLKFVNQLVLYPINLSNTFVSLDTINHLSISSDSTVYRALNGVRHIRNSLWFSPIDYCLSNHLSNFTTGPEFSLSVGFDGNIPFNCLQRLSKNIETKNLRKLRLGSAYHVLSNFNIIDSLETLILTAIFSDYSEIQKLTNLRHIEIEWDFDNNNFGEGFKNTYHLDTLILDNNKKIKTYFNIFPSLQTIRHHLYIIGNDALINLDFLKDVTLPKTSQDTISIMLQDNKLLNDCNVTFLCEAIARYPESVIIQNNGAKCTKEEIMKYCRIVNTTQDNHPKLVLSPNPTNGNIRIDHLKGSFSVNITNMSGQLVKTLSDIQTEINIVDLPAGMYIFDIRNKDISERHKIVKVE